MKRIVLLQSVGRQSIAVSSIPYDTGPWSTEALREAVCAITAGTFCLGASAHVLRDGPSGRDVSDSVGADSVHPVRWSHTGYGAWR